MMIKNNYSFLPLFISISFLFLAAKPDVYAQSGFAKAIPIDANVNIDDILFHQDQLILRGNIQIDSLGLIGLLIVGVDTNGLMLWKSIIYDTTLNSSMIINTPSRFIVDEDEQFVTPIKYFNTGQLAIYFTDLAGVKKKHKFYDHGTGLIFPFDIHQIYSDYYLTGVMGYEDGDLGIFAMKINANAEMAWIKYFGVPTLHEGTWDAQVNPDQTLTIYAARAHRRFLLHDADDGWKQPWVLTIDTSGNIIQEWLGQENDSRTLGGEYFVRLINGDWILQGTHYKNVPGPFGDVVKTSPTVTRLDSNFNQIWKVYLSDYEKQSYQIHDMDYDYNRDHIVLTGGKHIKAYNESEYVNWTIKIDTAGEILWNNIDTVYFSRQNSHYTAGLAIAPSGSIYVGGYVTVNELEPGSQAFVIKYTSDGCSDTLCTTTSITEQIRNWDNSIVLFPNPANDKIEILIKELSGGGDLKIFDLQGNRMLQKEVTKGKNSISILHLPEGLFMYSVLDDRGAVYSGKFVVQR